MTEREHTQRKHPRLKGYDYSEAGYYFITTCTKERRNVLSTVVGRGILDAPMAEVTEYGKLVEEAILFLSDKSEYICVDKYVIMPNHIHMILRVGKNGASGKPRPTEAEGGASGKPRPTEEEGGASGKPRPTEAESGASGKPRPTEALVPKFMSSLKRYTNRKAGCELWQRSYYDHIIRSEADYLRIWEYIETNPAKWREDEYYC